MSHATYKCKDCGESFTWKDFGNDGYCKRCDPYKVDSSHTDPIQIETAAVLKYRQRARVAEELNAIMLAALNEISKDRDRPLAECKTSEMKAIEWERVYLYVTKRATTALNKCQEIK